jgi:uncharacterized protein (TIGR02646 family)
MLDLNKTEPQFFIDYKDKLKPKRYQEDCNNYELKDNLRISLLDEQNNQCFYCEKKISNNTDLVHIDHIKQRNNYPKLECDYNNLVLSCSDKNHCGKYKDNQNGYWDTDIYLDLDTQNPSQYFRYMTSGKIVSEDTKATNTINYLNLNYKDLIEARKNINLQIEMYKTQGFDTKLIYSFYLEFENLFKEETQ